MPKIRRALRTDTPKTGNIKAIPRDRHSPIPARRPRRSWIAPNVIAAVLSWLIATARTTMTMIPTTAVPPRDSMASGPMLSPPDAIIDAPDIIAAPKKIAAVTPITTYIAIVTIKAMSRNEIRFRPSTARLWLMTLRILNGWLPTTDIDRPPMLDEVTAPVLT